MSGRVGDGHGILDGIGQVLAALNAADIPAMVFDDSQVCVAYTGRVPTVGDSIEYITLSTSSDWAAVGGNSDDLAEVYAAVVDAVTAAAHGPFVPYWGPDYDTTARNVLIFNGSAVTLSLGWPNSDTHG